MTWERCERKAIPERVKATVMLRQEGRCADCGAKLQTGAIIFDHRPPLALRVAGDDANDPAKIDAICTACDGVKTPRDISEIAKTKRVAGREAEFRAGMAEKAPGRKRPRKGTIKSRGFPKRAKEARHGH